MTFHSNASPRSTILPTIRVTLPTYRRVIAAPKWTQRLFGMLSPLLANVLMLAAAHAATINVPASQPTIQAGINAAASGDTVLVAPGTYSSAGNFDIDFTGKLITVQSSGGAAVTTIDLTGSSASNQKHAFDFHSGETSSAIIRGFTIKNGFFDNGGGITIVDSSPTIDHNVFSGNASGAYGGAIAIVENNAPTNPTITNDIFTNNVAGDLTSNSGFGGAIEILVNMSNGVSNVSVSNCVFTGNVATYDGGAIDVSGFGNTSPTLHIANSSFTGNNANGFVAPNQVGNLPAPSAGHQPGAIDSLQGAVTIVNSVMWGDSTSTEYSTLNDPATSGGGSLAISFSDIQGGFAGTGNLNSNPLFSSGSDLRLPYNSPAINVGTTTGAPSSDLLGNTRDANPDMGAYEYVVKTTANAIAATANTAFNGQVAAFDDASGDHSPVGAFSASIDWGDTSASAGTITQPGGTGTAYVVVGSHTYTNGGTFTLAVTVTAATNLPHVTGSGSNTATVSAAAATHFSVSAPASATAGSAFNFTVTAQDQFNNTATGYAGTVHFTSSDGQAVLPANSTLTNGSGTFSATLKTVGNQTITATDTVTSSITGTSNTITVSAAAATHFSVSAPASATAGTAFNFTVTAQDQFNNTATGYAGTVHFTSSDGQAVLPANSTLTNGTGTFSATLKTVGNQTITATDTTTSSITGTSNTIAVSASTPVRLQSFDVD
jgi:hypothetical protein